MTNKVVVVLNDEQLEEVRRRAGLVPLSRWFRSLAFPEGESELGVSLGDSVENVERGPDGIRSSVNGDMAVEAPRGFDPRTISGVSQGVVPAVGFECRCVHSGCRGGKFTGLTRWANMCDGCKERGHAGEPRNCGECFNDTGPA